MQKDYSLLDIPLRKTETNREIHEKVVVETASDGSSIKVESVRPSNLYINAPPMAPPPSMAPTTTSGHEVAGSNTVIKVDALPLKSNLKKPSLSGKKSSPMREHSREEWATVNPNERRKVQWTDAHGKDLTQIKEIESR
eukprot:Gb_16946 [translate_table: standard]